MKIEVTEERYVCDVCGQPRICQCLMCGKDLCQAHQIELSIKLIDGVHWRHFSAYLCMEAAYEFLPLLEKMQGKSAAKDGSDWEATGHNPQYNEAQLDNIIAFAKGVATL